MKIVDEMLPADLFPLYKPEPPFMRFKGGVGYMGVILQSHSTGKIQCHFCGELHRNIAKHAWHKHGKMTDDSYREQTGLDRHTPLVCESTSQKIREKFTKASKTEQKEIVDRLILNNRRIHSTGLWNKRKTGVGARIQYLNRNGTCDLQAKHLFWKECQALGHIPTNSEMSQKLRYLVYSRFKSYNDALRTWGVSQGDIDHRVTQRNKKAYEGRKAAGFGVRYVKENVLSELQHLYKKNKGRLPTWTEGRNLGVPTRPVLFRLFGANTKQKLEEIIASTI